MISVEDAKRLAVHCASVADPRPSYFTDKETFEPHAWVVEAIRIASDSLKTELEFARRLVGNADVARQAANKQAESLYDTVANIMTPKQRAVFRAKLGLAVGTNPISDSMGFGEALALLYAGEIVYRKSWDGTNQWLVFVERVAYQVALPSGTKLRGWVGLKTAQGEFTPWTPSQGDMQATDWEVLEQEETQHGSH